MTFRSRVKTRVDSAQAIFDAIRSVVLVGIPEEAREREDVPFGHAGIGYVNEYGSPAQHIPLHSHLILGVKSAEDWTIPELKKVAQAEPDGNTAGAESALNHDVRQYTAITGFTPLTDSTVETRARRGRKEVNAELACRTSGESPDTDLVKPSIDTGQYHRAITYVVRDKDASA